MSRGYLTFVQNNDKTDYLKLAYLQALSLKITNRINAYAVVVDRHTENLIEHKHRRVFDHIIPIPGDDEAKNQQWKMHNEWKALIASPFDETIKIESDMLFTANIDHWWDILKLKDVCFTNLVTDYTGKVSTTRNYRQVFDINQLPDIYAGFYYFKKSSMAEELFSYAEAIFKNWIYVKNYLLKNAEREPASTDLVFALAAKMLDTKNCTLPGEVPCFVHMKNAVQGWDETIPWNEMVYTEFDEARVTVGFHRQRLPFHYHLKHFVKPETIQYYEQLYFERNRKTFI